MSKQSLITGALVLVTIICASGQGQLILSHKTKPRKKKDLDLNRVYEIVTRDTVYESKIVAFTDSTLSVVGMYRTGRDTTYTHSSSYTIYKNPGFLKRGTPKDTTYSYSVTEHLYRQDTLVLSFNDIRFIKKDWFERREWVTPFAWFGVGAAMGVILLPVAAIDEGSKGVKDWLVFEGVLLGVSVPPLFIATRKTKYNIRKKWDLEIGG